MTAAFAIPLILLCIILEGFFSGSEIALVSADKVGIRAHREDGGRSVRLLARFLEEPERILTTTLIGTNASTVSATTLTALLMGETLARQGIQVDAELVTVIVLTPVILLLGELIPKSLYRRYSQQIAPIVIHPLTWLSVGLAPVIWMVRGVTQGLMRLLGAEQASGMAVSREELRLLLERGEGEEIEQVERQMINRIFDFPEVTVKEVMRPLIDVIGVDEAASLRDAVALFVQTGYSRLPVFHERVDDVVGVLHSLDVLGTDDLDVPTASLMRPVPYVPPTQKVEVLLEDLQRQNQGIAMVVDEYGGAEGLVTVEDILEEIVGEIVDEHDEPGHDIRQIDEMEYVVSARVEIDRLNEALDLEIPEEGDFETLAGYLLECFSRIPREGDIVESDRATLTVQRASSRAIEEVRIFLRKQPDQPDDE